MARPPTGTRQHYEGSYSEISVIRFVVPVCFASGLLEKCEFMQESMQYLGFDVSYGWWTPAASKAKPLMDAKVRHDDPKKGLHDVRSFIGACNFYRRHIKNFTYTSAILTDLIKKSTTWRWGQ